MGLDMYLKASVYIGANYEHREVSGIVDIKMNGQPIVLPLNKISSVELSVGYWRKANAIHKYFVDNFADGNDDCSPMEVGIKDLENLKQHCEKVLAHPFLAEELLPTTNGFFFGSTQYDDYYFEYLRDTINIIDEALSVKLQFTTYKYAASW